MDFFCTLKAFRNFSFIVVNVKKYYFFQIIEFLSLFYVFGLTDLKIDYVGLN